MQAVLAALVTAGLLLGQANRPTVSQEDLPEPGAPVTVQPAPRTTQAPAPRQTPEREVAPSVPRQEAPRPAPTPPPTPSANANEQKTAGKAPTATKVDPRRVPAFWIITVGD